MNGDLSRDAAGVVQAYVASRKNQMQAISIRDAVKAIRCVLGDDGAADDDLVGLVMAWALADNRCVLFDANEAVETSRQHSGLPDAPAIKP